MEGEKKKEAQKIESKDELPRFETLPLPK